MNLPRSAADVLADHVTLEIECIDRMYLNVYQPRLQHPQGVVSVSACPPGPAVRVLGAVGADQQGLRAAIYRFADDRDCVVDFAKGERKDDVAHAYLAELDHRWGVVRRPGPGETAVFRTEKRRNPTTGATYPWIVKTTAMVNHFYFYGLDDDFGPFFIKFCSYFPYNAKLCINGNEWAKRQAAKAGYRLRGPRQRVRLL